MKVWALQAAETSVLYQGMTLQATEKLSAPATTAGCPIQALFFACPGVPWGLEWDNGS
jgi:hypothetical protein